jgi:hypothetical protein
LSGLSGPSGPQGLIANPYSGILTITNTTVASSTVTGALQVRGGIGVGAGIIAGGAVTATGLTLVGSSAVIKLDSAGNGNGYQVFKTDGNNISIGTAAGSGAAFAVSIGLFAGSTNQGLGGIALGEYAGSSNQGQYAIAIGTGAGQNDQPAGSIVLDATWNGFTPFQARNTGTYIAPIRADATTSATTWNIFYNPTTRELTTATVFSNLNVTDGTVNVLKAKQITVTGAPNQGTYAGYLLLAKAYTSGNVVSSSVIGRFYLKRGGTSSGNRVDIYDVSSNSAYQTEDLSVQVTSNLGQFFSRTVKVTYNSIVYHAIETSVDGGIPDNGVWFNGTYVNCDPIYVDATSVSSITDYSGALTFLYSNGNLGIGTNSPSGKLHLYQTSGGSNILTLDTNFGSGNAYAINPFITGISNGGFSIRDVTNSVDRLVIQYSTGNIGIGTTSPVNRLEVKGVFGAPSTSGTSQDGIARFSQATGPGSLDIGFGDPYSWLQSRSSSNYATNYNIALNPNGGNVGIGTTSPGSLLTVNGVGSSNIGVLSILASAASQFTWASSALAANLTSGQNIIHMIGQANNSANAGYIGYKWSSSGSTTDNLLTFGHFGYDNLMNLTASGNLGIGTTQPSYKLTVVGANTSGTPLVQFNATGTGAFQRGVQLFNTSLAAGESIMYSVGTADSSRQMGQMYYYYAGSNSTSNRLSFGLHSVDDVLNILGTGNVGIGTTSPSAKLDLSSSTSGMVARFKSTGNYGTVVSDNGGTTGGGAFAARQNGTQYAVFGVNGAIQGDTSTDTAIFADGTGSVIKLYTNGSPTVKATLDTAGNFSVPQGNISASGSVTASGSGTSGGFRLYSNSGMTASNNYFNLFTSQTNGWAFNANSSGADSNKVAYIDASGNMNLLGTLTENSSITVKENINPITNALNLVMQLVGVTYDRRDGSAKNRAGLIAEEVDKVLPNLVQHDNIGNATGISYTNIIAYLVEAIKELNTEIETLKAK